MSLRQTRQLEDLERRFGELENKLADPLISSSPGLYTQLCREHSELQPLVLEYRRLKELDQEIAANRELRQDADPEMADLALEELGRLEPAREFSHQAIQRLLLPVDPLDQRNVVFEVRAGAGGEEAALFVAELFGAYRRYAERKGWRIEVLSLSPSDMGGLREIIAEIQGERVYSQLKWEAGVHRVQRVPQTEAQGRVHTSTVTLAVLPEAQEVDVVINPQDLRTDVYRSGGAGGQGVNTTDSAVRITHIPSGLVVVCQDERSQIKNKSRALKILRSRLLDLETARAQKSHSDARRSMVGTGDRSERIRTYNFPQARVTDHRIGLSSHRLEAFMGGDMEEIIPALIAHYQMEALRLQGAETPP